MTARFDRLNAWERFLIAVMLKHAAGCAVLVRYDLNKTSMLPMANDTGDWPRYYTWNLPRLEHERFELALEPDEEILISWSLLSGYFLVLPVAKAFEFFTLDKKDWPVWSDPVFGYAG